MKIRIRDSAGKIVFKGSDKAFAIWKEGHALPANAVTETTDGKFETDTPPRI